VNFFSMLRLFMVKPYSNAKIFVEWQGMTVSCRAQHDGFFRFECDMPNSLIAGWHTIIVRLDEEKYQSKNIYGTGEVNIPFDSTYIFISDIDDTFLVSHSSTLRKRLYVLFTKNARSRKPFDDVVMHYDLLASSGQQAGKVNPFFYVSSSEWNLFDYIKEFSKEKKLPKGVYLLNELKLFSQILRTGQNKHATKFFRIARIFEAHPQQRFVLFGDDSQEDPNIYSSLADHFADRIFAVYIRRVNKIKYEEVKKAIDKMQASGIRCCYFQHSIEAIMHSREIGLISGNV
jgi:phosphatidate phosphatase APP1